MRRSGARSLTAFKRGVTRRHDVDGHVAVAFEGVLDEPGDVLLVLDDEDT